MSIGHSKKGGNSVFHFMRKSSKCIADLVANFLNASTPYHLATLTLSNSKGSCLVLENFFKIVSTISMEKSLLSLTKL
ncbi:hypothetical protein WICPIJ_004119 [Wickerhamomyces pijperi]|uniref:Uncharacterized protein n=1 Tax=Wickerhamomyces pijperi TaxID=599730 RepID=A0A9P8Q6K3_WICPI|nr:hypothetical protein WICPIJ_004119 [Wickerhamomyces pijperi]